MFYKKGKANFYLRVLVMVKKRLYHGIGCVLTDPSPQGVGGRARSGLQLGFHLSTASNGPVMGGRWGNRNDNAHEHGRVNTVSGTSSKGRPFCEGWGGGSPEEVLLQGWGYGRTRTDPFPLRIL